MVITRAFTGDYSSYKLGESNIQYSSAFRSGFCFCGNISHSTSTIYTIHVGGWDDFWLWLWIFNNHSSGSYWHISSIFYWFSLPLQDSGLYLVLTTHSLSFYICLSLWIYLHKEQYFYFYFCLFCRDGWINIQKELQF